MSGPMIFIDDLNDSCREYGEGELDWDWDLYDDDTRSSTAVLRLDLGDSGPLDAEGPCLVTYRRTEAGDLEVASIDVLD